MRYGWRHCLDTILLSFPGDETQCWQCWNTRMVDGTTVGTQVMTLLRHGWWHCWNTRVMTLLLHSWLMALLLRHGWWHCWNTWLMTHSWLMALLLRHGWWQYWCVETWWWHCWNTLVDGTTVETRVLTLLKHMGNDTTVYTPNPIKS